MKVEQYEHANQFHKYDYTQSTYDIDCLQSYDRLVVKTSTNKYTGDKYTRLGYYWDYSTTTSKHVYAFLEEYGDINFYGITNKRAYVNKLIKDGVIKYDENMK